MIKTFIAAILRVFDVFYLSVFGLSGKKLLLIQEVDTSAWLCLESTDFHRTWCKLRRQGKFEGVFNLWWVCSTSPANCYNKDHHLVPEGNTRRRTHAILASSALGDKPRHFDYFSPLCFTHCFRRHRQYAHKDKTLPLRLRFPSRPYWIDIPYAQY